jgi:hypothetical protein
MSARCKRPRRKKNEALLPAKPADTVRRKPPLCADPLGRRYSLPDTTDEEELAWYALYRDHNLVRNPAAGTVAVLPYWLPLAFSEIQQPVECMLPMREGAGENSFVFPAYAAATHLVVSHLRTHEPLHPHVPAAYLALRKLGFDSAFVAIRGAANVVLRQALLELDRLLVRSGRTPAVVGGIDVAGMTPLVGRLYGCGVVILRNRVARLPFFTRFLPAFPASHDNVWCVRVGPTKKRVQLPCVVAAVYHQLVTWQRDPERATKKSIQSLVDQGTAFLHALRFPFAFVEFEDAAFAEQLAHANDDAMMLRTLQELDVEF